MHLRSTASLCILLLVTTGTAHAENYVAAMNYVSLDGQADDSDSRQFSATISGGIGDYTWLQGSVGKLTTTNSTDTLGDLSTIGAGVGFSNQNLQATLHFNRYKNDAAYQQRDLTASLDWLHDKFTIGLDLLNRHTDNSSDMTRDFDRLGVYNVAIHIDETLNGTGIGLHANFDLSDALSLSLSGMSYNYSSDYSLSSSTNPTLVNVLRNYLSKHPTASQLFYLNNSPMTRALALLDNSYSVGLSYQFNTALLAADYIRDQALDTDAVTNTVTLSGSFFVGDHWMLSPQVGQSHSEDASAINFGALSVSYNW